jgi:hypothetical protein
MVENTSVPSSASLRKAQLNQARVRLQAEQTDRESEDAVDVITQDRETAHQVRSAQFGNKLQGATGIREGFVNPSTTAQPKETTEQDPSLYSKYNDQRATLGRMKRFRIREQVKEEQSEKSDALIDAAKKKAKATIRRGVIWAVNTIASAIDLGSLGISLFITLNLYMITFGYLNIELFYGLKFRKGQDKIIPAISWEPIPMPIDPHRTILMGLIVSADIMILLFALVLFFMGFCVLITAINVYQNPFAFALSAARGTSGVCVSGITNFF